MLSLMLMLKYGDKGTNKRFAMQGGSQDVNTIDQVAQGFPYWGIRGSPPHQPKICSFPPSGKITSPPVDSPPTKFLFPLPYQKSIPSTK